MKTSQKMFFILIAATVVTFVSCDKNENASSPYDVEILEVADDGASTLLVNNFEETLSLKTDSLSSESLAELIFLLEEEKMAHDLYTSFFGFWNLQIFDRISRSEETHFNAVKTLLDFYEFPYEISEETGVFINEEIQNLYDAFLAEGAISMENSLVAGAKVEEIDIADLMSLIETTTDEHALLLYNNLLIGSRNHLRAFYRNMLVYGIEYTPYILDQNLFDEIVNSTNERGQNCTMNGENGNQSMHQNRNQHRNRGGKGQ